MSSWRRTLVLFMLLVFGLGAFLYLQEKWRRVEKHVVVIMRSSNEDCDEFRCIWKIDRVLHGELTSAEARAFCYLTNAKREYGRRDSVEWLEVTGGFTHEKGQAFYADCIGTLVFQDKTIRPIAAAANGKSVATARRRSEQTNQKK